MKFSNYSSYKFEYRSGNEEDHKQEDDQANVEFLRLDLARTSTKSGLLLLGRMILLLLFQELLQVVARELFRALFSSTSVAEFRFGIDAAALQPEVSRVSALSLVHIRGVRRVDVAGGSLDGPLLDWVLLGREELDHF